MCGFNGNPHSCKVVIKPGNPHSTQQLFVSTEQEPIEDFTWGPHFRPWTSQRPPSRCTTAPTTTADLSDAIVMDNRGGFTFRVPAPPLALHTSSSLSLPIFPQPQPAAVFLPEAPSGPDTEGTCGLAHLLCTELLHAALLHGRGVQGFRFDEPA